MRKHLGAIQKVQSQNVIFYPHPFPSFHTDNFLSNPPMSFTKKWQTMEWLRQHVFVHMTAYANHVMSKEVGKLKDHNFNHRPHSLLHTGQGMKRGLRPPSFKSGPRSNSWLQSPPFEPLNITYDLLKQNSANGEMDEGHIWLSSTIQTSRNKNTSDGEGFKQ